MRRWLASGTDRPRLLIVLGLIIVATGVWVVVSASGIERYLGAFFIVVGCVNAASGVAALREQRSGSSL